MTNQPAPTRAPTEQDRAPERIRVHSSVLFQTDEDTGLGFTAEYVTTEEDEGDGFDTEYVRADILAAALQAERERTRAEVWDKAITTLHQMKYDYQSIYRHEEGVDLCLAAIVRLESARALEAAQLPQGKDK
jgi:hypothetical protein